MLKTTTNNSKYVNPNIDLLYVG